ncbi:MAG: hypothetical protein IPG58_17780 [Acidobacteria bacterium]|nr:hypothetical protein [Acidobacteriota bacterium]
MIKGDSKVWSLERQVRFAAGAFVLTGFCSAFCFAIFHPAVGFCRGGLMFSAVTDTCGMGMVLAKMP